MNEIVLSIQKLTKQFGDITVVNNLSLAIPHGEVFGLIGSNGAGKTTTIKMLTTLLKPTSGTAFIAGFDILKHPADVRRSIGYVPQLLSADGSLTGYENLLIFAKLYDIPRSERKKRIDEAFSLMDLTDAKDRFVKNYSGGMIRRLEIAQAVLHKPSVLFLDEPTVGLDPVARQSVWNQIELLKEGGTTIILTTHYMEEADFLCTRIAILNKGILVVEGIPDELKASLKKKNATLDDVFSHYAEGIIETGGTFRDISRTRRTASRLG